jgi:hypothetical protein
MMVNTTFDVRRILANELTNCSIGKSVSINGGRRATGAIYRKICKRGGTKGVIKKNYYELFYINNGMRNIF